MDDSHQPPSAEVSIDDLRVVVAHDFMETYGGAERIAAEIAKAFPKAPFVALLGRDSVARRMGVGDRFTSLLPPHPRLLRHYRMLAPAFPLLADHLRLPDASVVVSSSYAFAHRLRARTGDAPRICYSYSPMRFAWSMTGQYRSTWASDRTAAAAFRAFASAMRWSDRRSAQLVARYLAPNQFVAEQIRRFYGREPEIVGVPVDCDLFRPADEPPGDYFLFCGRLVEPYKKVTILVEAFNRLGERLIVAGDGPERKRLEALAGPNVEFTGLLEDQELVPLMQRCRAAIFPSQDDFGLIPVEVMACGRPVLAYAGGGALDTVVPGRTGELFGEQTVAAIMKAVSDLRPDAYDPADLRAHATQWAPERFRARFVEAVLHTVEECRRAPEAVPLVAA